MFQDRKTASREERIRISVSHALAPAFLSMGMASLATRFPHLVVELVPDLHELGTNRREPEIALRTGRPLSADLAARRLSTSMAPETWLLMRPEVARLARVRAVADHLLALLEQRPFAGSEAA